MLGLIIGAGAGLAAGLPLRSWANNEAGDGDRVLATFLAAGIGRASASARLRAVTERFIEGRRRAKPA